MIPVPSPSPRLHGWLDGPIGWLVFDHPQRRNAVSLDMWAAVPAVLDALENDPAVRVVVVRGGGSEAFISGADISEFAERRASERQESHFGDIAAAAVSLVAGPAKARKHIPAAPAQPDGAAPRGKRRPAGKPPARRRFAGYK